ARAPRARSARRARAAQAKEADVAQADSDADAGAGERARARRARAEAGSTGGGRALRPGAGARGFTRAGYFLRARGNIGRFATADRDPWRRNHRRTISATAERGGDSLRRRHADGDPTRRL